MMLHHRVCPPDRAVGMTFERAVLRMRAELHQRLRCPKCHGRLGLQTETSTNDRVNTGWLDCWTCVQRYPIVAGIPRIVPCETYADTFGILWDAFRHAVLDSSLGLSQNRERFLGQTAWTPEELSGKWLLEIGCGAGRFTEIAHQCGAHVVAVDYSTAIDVCHKNLGDHSRLHYVQGDIYGLPFRPGMFDFVCCFGVLHRLPDARTALLQLPQQLKTGGKLAVDIAPPRWLRRFGPTAWLRMITRRMNREQATRFAMALARNLLPIQRALGSIPLIGLRLERFLPIAPIDTIGLCSREVQEERACLAMCDRLMATHHRPGCAATLREWLAEAGMDQPEVFQNSMIVGRGHRATTPAGSTGRPSKRPTNDAAAAA